MLRSRRKHPLLILALLMAACRVGLGVETAVPAGVNPPPAGASGEVSPVAPESALVTSEAPVAPDGATASAALGAEPADAGDPGAQLFMRKCAGCHTIGGGALSGPDLKVVQSWPRQNIDPAILRMEKNVGKLNPEEVELLAVLMLQPDAASRLAEERKRMAMKEMASLEPANAAIGEALFYGNRVLSNRGLACAACHGVGGVGGNLASDLTGSFAKLGEVPLMSTIEGVTFPLMQAAYAAKPITKQEALHLVKYLEVAGAQPVTPRRSPPMHAIGAFGAILAFAGVSWSYRNRNRGVRAKLVRDAMRRSRS